MKIVKIVSIALVSLLVSCATKHEVITESGEVYEVQGDKFFNQGKEVTNLITEEDKEGIVATLNKRLTTEAEIAAEQSALQEAQDYSEELRKDAEKAQKKAKKEANALEKKLKSEKKARDNYIKSSKELKKAQAKYDRLHDKGKLSPKDEEKWTKKLKKLISKYDKAEKNLNKI